jgi:hypothetical protein
LGIEATRCNARAGVPTFAVIARSESDEAIQLSPRQLRDGLLCGDRARVRATRWLAMTALRPRQIADL